MKYFTISDLHLSLSAPFDPDDPGADIINKPMNVFGSHWDDYLLRLSNNWQETVGKQDIVLVPGDISWAMNLAEAKHDLDFIGDLPGEKILIRGNHDYWWDGIKKLRKSLPKGMFALQNDAIDTADFAVCGTRGWLLPDNKSFKEKDDRKIYKRELHRLTMALNDAGRFAKPIIVMLHYPPIDVPIVSDEFVALMKEYPVSYCVYGHVHGNKAAAFEGEYQGIEFINASVDRIGFAPKEIIGE